MSKLEILRVNNALIHGNISICLKGHHGERTARKHVADYEFSKDIKTDLDVGDGLNHANRNLYIISVS